MSSFYEVDKKCEEIVSKWVEENIFNQPKFNGEYIRNENEELQKSGADLFLKSDEIFEDNEEYVIDEKCATSYIKTDVRESNIPTFAFELDYEGKSGKRNDGWLYGSQFKDTDYYLLYWLWANVERRSDKLGKKEQVSKDNILKVKAFLIEKKKVQEYLVHFKITPSNYRRASHRLRNEMEENKVYINKNKNRKTPNVQYNAYLKEKPVTVIISENDLRNMAIKCWEVEV